MYISDETVLQMERQRQKLMTTLRDKGFIIEDDNITLSDLVDLVDQTEYKVFEKLATLIPQDIINDKIKTVESEAFSNLKTGGKLHLENCVSLKQSALLNANFTNLKLPNVVNAGGFSLYNLSRVKNIILPKLRSITTQQIVGSSAALTRVITPQLYWNGGNAYYFYNCAPILVDAQYLRGLISGNVNSIKTIILRDGETLSNMASTSFKALEEVYVPQALLETYKAATNWSVFSDRIFALEGSKYEAEDWYLNEEWYKTEEEAVWQ